MSNVGTTTTKANAAACAYYRGLGAHIALLRKARGMTQGELARTIGVSQQAVFAYEFSQRRISLFPDQADQSVFDPR